MSILPSSRRRRVVVAAVAGHLPQAGSASNFSVAYTQKPNPRIPSIQVAVVVPRQLAVDTCQKSCLSACLDSFCCVVSAIVICRHVAAGVPEFTCWHLDSPRSVPTVVAHRTGLSVYVKKTCLFRKASIPGLQLGLAAYHYLFSKRAVWNLLVPPTVLNCYLHALLAHPIC